MGNLFGAIGAFSISLFILLASSSGGESGTSIFWSSMLEFPIFMTSRFCVNVDGNEAGLVEDYNAPGQTP